MPVHIKYQVHFASLGKDSFDESKRMGEVNSLGNGHMETLVVWFSIEGTCILLSFIQR